MKSFIVYLIMFLLVYLFYIIFVLCRKNILKKFPNGKEMQYLKFKYGVKVNDTNIKKIANSVFLANSFILSTTVLAISFFDGLILEIVVGLVTLVLLMLIIYHLIGIYYKKKQGGK